MDNNFTQEDPSIFVIDDRYDTPRQLGQTCIGSRTPGKNSVYLDYERGSDQNSGRTPEFPLKTRKAAFIVWKGIIQ